MPDKRGMTTNNNNTNNEQNSMNTQHNELTRNDLEVIATELTIAGFNVTNIDEKIDEIEVDGGKDHFVFAIENGVVFRWDFSGKERIGEFDHRQEMMMTFKGWIDAARIKGTQTKNGLWKDNPHYRDTITGI